MPHPEDAERTAQAVRVAFLMACSAEVLAERAEEIVGRLNCKVEAEEALADVKIAYVIAEQALEAAQKARGSSGRAERRRYAAVAMRLTRKSTNLTRKAYLAKYRQEGTWPG
jgi:hypothetical protein